MKKFTMIIEGDEISHNDVLVMTRHFASTYEQELIHKDAGPDAAGAYVIPFDDRDYTVTFQVDDAEVPDLKAPAAVTDPNSVEIPEGWQDLKAAELRAIAGKLSADPVANNAEAVAVIEAELARRVEAGKAESPAEV
jgi:hypothetical protein